MCWFGSGLPPYDAEWADATEQSNCETRRVLEGRLATARSRAHKDAIRTAYLALAEHDARTGRDHHTSLAALLVVSENTSNSNNNDNNNTETAAAAAPVIHTPNGALYRAMDCCTSRIQSAQIGLLIIESALNSGDYATVKEYTGRLESTFQLLRVKGGAGSGGAGAIHSSRGSNSSLGTNSNNNSNHHKDPNQDAILWDIGVKVEIAKGIERMVSGDYQKAASVLVSLVMKGSEGGGSSNNENNSNHESNNQHPPPPQQSNERHTLHWPGVTAPEDVALYAGLMCLVTRDRSKMMALADHPDALELMPSVKELLVHWSRANYAPCMRALLVGSDDTNHPSLLQSSSSSLVASLSQPLLPMGMVVDAYLTPSRWEALVRTLRGTCLIEYLRPYQRVKLEGLRDLFFPSSSSSTTESKDDSSSLDGIVDILVDLMDRGLLPSTTRLDCREGVLFQTEAPTDPAPTLQATEEKILDDTHAMLVRLACLEHDLGLVSIDATALGSRRGKKGGRRYPQRGKGNRGQPPSHSRGMDDSIASDDDDDDGIHESSSYEARVEGAGGEDGGGTNNDTHMIDAESSSQNYSAMNPEDLY